MTLKKSDGIGEENIKQLVSESRGVKLGIETVEKLTKKPRTFLTIKYQVRLHVRSAA